MRKLTYRVHTARRKKNLRKNRILGDAHVVEKTARVLGAIKNHTKSRNTKKSSSNKKRNYKKGPLTRGQSRI